ncbi:hypothetical protein CKAN_02009800 [Cinnamomum micranthum f. kanehirae]|uniref:Uncharacterized protein n=1 Tax=Cinnamomum micranthum f. kanehirae TaxID=337451 RepID=A0A443PJN6_9MAGN|nr:hypothetical protein CKAN_02009800 [Cinnamomum micranthum f. kanehirae]
MAVSNGSEPWMLMVTARSPTNIAVIKYWGKRDETLIFPINDSISVTLDPDHLCTTTTVAVSPAFDSDRMWLNGKVRRFRFDACLQGSGSACRSLYGGFVKWVMGNVSLISVLWRVLHWSESCPSLDINLNLDFLFWHAQDASGHDSIAIQLANESHWDDLVIIIAVVVVPQRILQMEEAIRNRDFQSFARLTCADSNQLHAVCLDTSPPIFYMNDTSRRHVLLYSL